MDENKRFEVLEKEFFRGYVSRNPLLGTTLGLHEFDDQLPVPGVEGIQDQIAFLKSSLARFQKIHARAMPPRRQIDLQFAIQFIQSNLFELEEVRMWERVPEAPYFLGASIYQILGRNYAPLAERFLSIISRMEKLPKYLRGSLTKLNHPVKLHVENELETVTRLAGFFYNIREIGKENLSRKDLKRMWDAVDEVQDAVEELCDTLIIDILPDAHDGFAMDEGLYRKFLKIRGVPWSPDQLLSRAEKEQAAVERRLRELARPIKKKIAPEDVRDLLRSRHPENFAEVLEFTRETVKRAREFVSQNRLCAVPKHETLFILEMPSYMRHTNPLTAYWPPGRFDKSQEGYFFLTPPDCESSRLREHNFAALSNLVTHMAYPGHHLQRVAANDNPALIRALADDPITTEGWSFYVEEKMKEAGFDDSPENRFWTSVDEIWRLARVAIDVKLTTGKFTPKEAVAYLAEHTGLDWVCAEAEIRRYLLTPTAQVSYFVGKTLLKELREEARRQLKGRYSDKFFHDTVLGAAPIPIPLLSQELSLRIEAQLKKAPSREEPAAAPRTAGDGKRNPSRRNRKKTRAR
jgi:uncharacterized protein (DUF885 family)